MNDQDKLGSSEQCLEMLKADLGGDDRPDEPVLKQVSWTVKKGDFWVVSGLHRSGKSTLLSAVAMLQKPLSGEIKLFGVDPWSGDEEVLIQQRLRLGVVFEAGERLLHQMSVAENVALPICYHENCSFDEAEERVAKLLEFTGMLSMSSNMPGNLSRMYRQRASLARALALKPKMLLLDNPLAAMDPREKHWWLETVEALAEGHPITGGEPLTLILTADDARPWMEEDRIYGLLHESSWRHFGGLEALKACDEPLVKEIFL